MREKKHLSFSSLIHGFRSIVDSFEDKRTENSDYSLTDIVLSGFACMYFQDPSLLQFQKRLEDDEQRSNLKTLFSVEKVPESTQLRNVLDTLPSESISHVFKEFFHRLQRGKHLEQYQYYRGTYVVSIDGTQYHSSKNVSCKHCLRRQHRGGEESFSHQALQAAVVHPELSQVLPLMVEDISNQDGGKKQDCEINAAKRLIPRLRTEHPQLDITIVGDALFSKQPMVELVRSERMNYIFGVKPDDHKVLFEWLSRSEEDIGELCLQGEKSKTYRYRWLNDVPLSGREDALSVNFFELSILATDKNGNQKTTFRSSWVTNIPLSEKNVERLTKAARSRWKIENECFNNLKNHGYYLEHNFGHGQEYLSFNFYQLTLLAFFMHQVFELTDKLFQACREKAGTKRALWEYLRVAINWFVFDSWHHLLEFILSRKKPSIQALSP